MKNPEIKTNECENLISTDGLSKPNSCLSSRSVWFSIIQSPLSEKLWSKLSVNCQESKVSPIDIEYYS